MKHLQTFSIFESTQNLTPEQVEFLDKYTDGTWSVNPSTGLVDVKGNFKCYGINLKDFNGVRFGHVSGTFDFSPASLESLEGAPKTVGGDFDCSNNSLETLVGAPQTVGGFFDCYNNSLTTLEGAPQTVGGDFDCSNNSLETLVGAPQTVGGFFDCYNNSLTTLEGAPQTVGGNFDCYYNYLTTLEGAPQTVGGSFSSDEVKIPEGGWTVPNLVKQYSKSRGKKKDLLGTLVSPEVLQRRIDQNPEKMIILTKDDLKGILATPGYENLNFPQGLQPEIDLLSDLSGVGL